MNRDKRIAQIVCGFLKLAPDNTLHGQVLLKLMYFLDRKYIQAMQRPPSRDCYIINKNGPVLSATSSYLKDQESYLHNFIEKKGQFVKLKKPINNPSGFVSEDVKKIYHQCSHMNHTQIINFSREFLDEWSEEVKTIMPLHPLVIEKTESIEDRLNRICKELEPKLLQFTKTL